MALSTTEKNNIQLVWNGMAAILETKDEAKVEASFAEDFIQHNPWAQDGIAHIKEMLAFGFGYKPIRWVVDNDIMAYHGYYTAPNPLGDHPLLCVDAWRIEHGKIQEHWDGLAPLPQELLEKAVAGAGNGELEVSDETRKANKATVKRFLDHVLNRGRIDQIKALVSDAYTYHHESAGELKGYEVIENFLKSQNDGKMLHDNKLLLASGDLVMAHSHYFGENERVVFDWFRLEHGKIAEHWSVEQPITPLEEVANEHPHF
ncbi:MAG: nuclear transport factor 2 family protein [Bacteroidota bacterium]